MLLGSVSALVFCMTLLAFEWIANSHIEVAYLIGTILFLLVAGFSYYDYRDDRPIYILNNEGFLIVRSDKILKWGTLGSYLCKEVYRKNLNIQRVDFFDKNGELIERIDLAFTNCTLNKIETRLSKKIKRRYT